MLLKTNSGHELLNNVEVLLNEFLEKKLDFYLNSSSVFQEITGPQDEVLAVCKFIQNYSKGRGSDNNRINLSKKDDLLCKCLRCLDLVRKLRPQNDFNEIKSIDRMYKTLLQRWNYIKS